MAERANNRHFDYGYDDSMNGDLLRDIDEKILMLQETQTLPTNFIRTGDDEGRMTANAALYGPQDLSGISGLMRAEQTVMLQDMQRFTHLEPYGENN